MQAAGAVSGRMPLDAGDRILLPGGTDNAAQRKENGETTVKTPAEIKRTRKAGRSLKIRSDFVTNSSSYSSVVITIRSKKLAGL